MVLFFSKTTLDDIATAVGLNKASLYYYYKNKEDIFLEITTDATRQFFETLKASTLAGPGGIEAQMRHFLVERAAYYLKIAAEIHISEEALRQVEHLFYEQISACPGTSWNTPPAPPSQMRAQPRTISGRPGSRGGCLMPILTIPPDITGIPVFIKKTAGRPKIEGARCKVVYSGASAPLFRFDTPE